MRICKKGIWDETIPGIKFDEEGVSNFCRLQEKMMADYPRGEKGMRDWENIIAKVKAAGKGKRYDCIVGVSGGVDSSYLLHMAKEYGLRPLAVNLDNGFNSEIAVQNIYKVTRKLNIDLETYVIDYEEIKDFLASYMKASLPWIDAPTDNAIKASIYKIANKEGIKYILRGNDFRSEGKQPKEWTFSDTKQMRYVYKKFGSGLRLKSYPFLSLGMTLYLGLVKGIIDIRPFYYLDYQKQKAKQMLMQEYDWKDYGGHHHENLFTKFAMAYWLPKKFGIDKRKINLSAQVLSGAITREKALEDVSKPFDTPENLEKLREYVCKKLDISQENFEKMWKAENKYYYDYPNNYDMIYSNVKYFKWIIYRLTSYKPMSIDSSEMIK